MIPMRILTILLAVTLSLSPLSASTYTVTCDSDAADANHGDDLCATSGSVCTFRAAVEESNAHDGLDTIVMGSGAPYVVELTELLPDIHGPLIIDALGCGGTCGTTYGLKIQGTPSLQRALLLDGAVTVRGVKVTGTFGSPSSAIYVDGIGGVLDCVRVEVDANVAVHVTTDAVQTQVLNSVIVGVPSGDCLQANAAEAVLVQANAIHGCEDGIYFSGSTGQVLHNLTSDQAHNGIHIDGGSDGVTVRGNRSGTSADALSADANGQEGVRVNDSNDAQVGGSLAGQRNILSGNTGYGVWVMGTSDGTHVEGNYLGLNASATPSLCNTSGDLHDDGTNTTDTNNTACPTPTPALGCCAATGAASCVSQAIAAYVSLPLTSLTECQAVLDAAVGTGNATATAYNPSAMCQGVTSPGTGTCP